MGTAHSLALVGALALCCGVERVLAAEAPGAKPVAAPTSPAKPKQAAIPTVLVVLDADTSGSGFAEQLKQVGEEVRAVLVEKGFPTTDLLRPDSAATRRAISERSINVGDLKRLNDMAAVTRLCQGLTRQLGVVVTIVRVEGTATVLKSMDTRSVLIDARGERQELFGVLVETAELVPDRRGIRPTLTAMAGRRIAEQVAKQVALWPPVTNESSLARANARADLAEQRAAQGDLPGAIAEINQALSLAQREIRFYRLAGDYYQRQGDLNFAALQYRRALTVNGEDATSHLRLAQVQARQNDLLEAAKSAAKAIKFGADSAEARRIIAAALIARREAVFNARPQDAPQLLDQAIQHLRRAAELEPNDFDLLARLAALLTESRAFNEAAELWSRVVKARTGDNPAREQLAHALYQSRRYDEAYEQFQLVVSGRNRARLDPETYRRLGFLLDRKTVQVFKDAKLLLEELDSGRQGREQALAKFVQIRDAAVAVTTFLGEATPPTAQAAAHSHRKLAYTFFDQAVSAYLTYLDTDDVLYRDRGMVLQTQAATEYDLARTRGAA